MVPFLSEIITIAGLVLFAAAIALVAASLLDAWDAHFVGMAVMLPGFDYELDPSGRESGNLLFGTYAQLRYAAFAVLGLAALAAAGLHFARLRYGSSSSPTSPPWPDTAAVLRRAALLSVALLAFPWAWDASSSLVEGAGLWILNPAYSFDPAAPCPPDWGMRRVLDEHGGSPYVPRADKDAVAAAAPGLVNLEPSAAAGGGSEEMRSALSVCTPNLRIHWLLQQAAGGTEAARGGAAGPLAWIQAALGDWAGGLLANVLLGFAKALLAINLSVLAFAVTAMVDVLLGLAITALPLFAVMSMVPRADRVASRFLEAVPALLLMPVLVAVVVVVGTAFLAALPADPDPFSGALRMWLAAAGVLFFTVGLPVLLVPLAGAVATHAATVITGAVGTAAVLTGLGSGRRGGGGGG